MVTGGPEANMKKESKAYSFADQKWDAEMRAELRRQRKASEGAEFEEERDVRMLLKKAKLSQKQQVKQLFPFPATRHSLPQPRAIPSPSHALFPLPATRHSLSQPHAVLSPSHALFPLPATHCYFAFRVTIFPSHRKPYNRSWTTRRRLGRD